MLRRKSYGNILCVGLTACFSFCYLFSFSQQVRTVADRNNILIGEQIRLIINVSLPPGTAELKNGFGIPDSIPHFDIVETGKAVSITNEDRSTTVAQTIVFTSFDSGRWVFPSLPLEFSDAGQKLQNVRTDSMVINVSYAPSDSTNQLRDIKPIIKVTVADYTWYYIIGGMVLLLLAMILLYRYRKKHQKLIPDDPASKLSPFDEAMEEISRLSQYNLLDATGLKQYHAKMAEIFKRYAGRKQGKNLMSKTTGDLLISMAEIEMTAADISGLATALRCTDAVKFAKYLPAVDESEDCLLQIKTWINLMEQQSIHHKP